MKQRLERGQGSNTGKSCQLQKLEEGSSFKKEENQQRHEQMKDMSNFFICKALSHISNWHRHIIRLARVKSFQPLFNMPLSIRCTALLIV